MLYNILHIIIYTILYILIYNYLCEPFFLIFSNFIFYKKKHEKIILSISFNSYYCSVYMNRL